MFIKWPSMAAEGVLSTISNFSPRDIGKGEGRILPHQLVSIIAQAGLTGDPRVMAELERLRVSPGGEGLPRKRESR